MNGSADEFDALSSPFARAAHWIALLAFLAIIGYGILKQPLFIFLLGAASALIGLPISFYKFVRNVLIPMLHGLECPRCGERRLQRVVCVSFGARYYCCPDCHLRCKRFEASEPWEDASGAEDADRYKTDKGADRGVIWGTLPTSEDRRNAAILLAALASPVVLGGLGCLLFGERGLGAAPLGVLIIGVVDRRPRRAGKPIAPAVWDREFDD